MLFACFRRSLQGPQGLPRFPQRLLRLPAALLGLLHHFPGHCFLRQPGRLRMAPGSAHRAGCALRQLPGQQSRLAPVVAFLCRRIGRVRAPARLQQLFHPLLLSLDLSAGFLQCFQRRNAVLDLPGLGRQRIRLVPVAVRFPLSALRLRQPLLRFLQGGFSPGGFLFLPLQLCPVGGQSGLVLCHLPGFPGRCQLLRQLVHPSLGFRQFLPLLLRLRQGIKVRVHASSLLDHDNQPLLFLFRLFLLLSGGLPRLFFALNQALQTLCQQIAVLWIPLVFLQDFPLRIFRLRADPARRQADPVFQILLLLPAGAVHFLQLPLQVGIDSRVEQLLKQLLSFVGGGVQNLQKVALGDHHRPGKLILSQSQQLVGFRVDLLQALDHLAGVRIGHPRGGALLRHPGSVFLRPLIFRAAADHPYLVPVMKGQLRVGLRGRVRIVGPEGFALPPLIPGGAFPIQGEADSIEEGGFPRPRVPGNQKQPVLSQGGKIHRGFPGIGSEGAQCQLQRSHASSSSSLRAFSMMLFRRSSGAWSLFCSL